jgi:hypothetical protein
MSSMAGAAPETNAEFQPASHSDNAWMTAGSVEYAGADAARLPNWAMPFGAGEADDANKTAVFLGSLEAKLISPHDYYK